MWVLFRSAKVAVGMIATCTSAVLATMLVQAVFGEKIGILTANLGNRDRRHTIAPGLYDLHWQTFAEQQHGDSHGLGAKAGE